MDVCSGPSQDVVAIVASMCLQVLTLAPDIACHSIRGKYTLTVRAQPAVPADVGLGALLKVEKKKKKKQYIINLYILIVQQEMINCICSGQGQPCIATACEAVVAKDSCHARTATCSYSTPPFASLVD